MADVARRAGVSIATVSRVLTGSRPVRAAMREPVLRAADELGYQVNLLGRALRRGKTSIVGLLVPDLDNPFFSSLAQRVSSTFDGSGIDILIHSAHGSIEAERRGVESLLGRQVDALVIIPCHEEGSALNVDRAARSTLTIQLDRRVIGERATFVGVDNHRGMELVAGHIERTVNISRQPVLFVGAAEDSSTGHERSRAFSEFFPTRPLHLGAFDFAWGQQVAMDLIADGCGAATIVTGADVIALGLMAQLQSKGYRVPEDFRVVGFDGVGLAGLAHPTLTTVRQPVERMGEKVLELVAGAGGADPETVIRLAPELVVGDSCPVDSS